MPSIAEIRARARAHAEEIESGQWHTPATLAHRWSVSETTVREIPAAQLPYKEFGAGEKLKRRRYRPVDVAAYEENHVRGAA